jgi:hypothetical protein
MRCMSLCLASKRELVARLSQLPGSEREKTARPGPCVDLEWMDPSSLCAAGAGAVVLGMAATPFLTNSTSIYPISNA